MQLIYNWLNASKNFHVGVCIYNIVGTDKAFKKLLAAGQTPYNEKQLEVALKDLVTKPIAIALAKPLRVETTEMHNNSDQVLQAIKNEWMPIYLAMNYQRHELDKYYDIEPCNCDSEAICDHNLSISELIENENRKAKRLALAISILEKEKTINQLWEKADYYREHGKLPEEKPNEWVVPTDSLALAKAINNCKKSIRRNRLNMQKFPNKPEYASLYSQYKTFHIKLTGLDYEDKKD